jgi:hypothetical protein
VSIPSDWGINAEASAGSMSHESDRAIGQGKRAFQITFRVNVKLEFTSVSK